MSEKLIFAQTFEGLLRSLGPRLSAEVKAGMRARGFEPEGKLLPAYPMEVFIDVVQYLAQTFHAGVPMEEGVSLVGRSFMDGFGETLIGRAMVGMMRVIGPVGALKRVTQEFRTGNNYSLTRLTELGPRRYQLWVNTLQMPGWYIGIVGRGLEFAGARAPRVSLLAREDEGGTFLIEWD